MTPSLFYGSTRGNTLDSKLVLTITLTQTALLAFVIPTPNHARECVSVTLLHVTIT